ncbi:nitric oxide synthase oxygenase [Bacillus sp. FJAT-49731]|uniref:Nitric oxide synthase oxygenase n=2 Tax=Lederbergia citrea TaxID=2833581 RepID=A0A942Z705_9BACI|nr:nitric oxide synthase oxygenase [Lederbergia citrea]MBS4206263.1 nitric oxide synthase oxygenase [Lederbergia citrea]MBS4224802.1 nitric oxide synthase oxygenase [Lederbergia citrea]
MELILMVQSTKINNLLLEAIQFIESCYDELGISEARKLKRIQEIKNEINVTGTYVHKTFELTHGAKMAWRNSNRCIGRLLWDTLHVFDARDVLIAEDAYKKLVKHINFATNDGKIRSAITIFAPRRNGKDPIRIWNHQLLRYAGYKEDDKIIGDSTSIKLTKMCERMGWQGHKTPFDILPLVIQESGKKPQLFKIPNEIIKEVPITHPQLDGFNELGVKWYAVPIISDMRLEIGGIDYPMAPFNGWYMGTEIGARNLADQDRYNLLPKVAKIMGLDTKLNGSLWIDKALIELNIAVLHSYQKAGVTIVDHHTAAKQFKKFEENEMKNGRHITGNWAWLIPPISPATTHIYHKQYKNVTLTPNYFYQENPQESYTVSPK